MDKFYSDNSYMNLNEMSWEETDIYDESFPMKLFVNNIKCKLKQSETVVKEIYGELLNDTSIAKQLEQAKEKGFRLVVDASESTLDAIDKGKIKLSVTKDGQMHAQIREANGHFGSKLPIKREDFERGIDPVQMANSLQLKALQDQMQDIANQLYMIDISVQEVLQGQQNDRIGLFYSGMSLFLEARSISDADMKKSLIVQSLRTLSDAIYQLSLNMQSDVRYLENKEYSNARGKNRLSLIDERMRNINKTFAYIHQAQLLKAGIYCELGEISAMTKALESYSQFIDGTVAKNVSLLAQCDIIDDGLDTGIWKSRANLKLDVTSISKQINTKDKVIYLDVIKEEQ